MFREITLIMLWIVLAYVVLASLVLVLRERKEIVCWLLGHDLLRQPTWKGEFGQHSFCFRCNRELYLSPKGKWISL